jgi:hypothetical protein
MKLVQKVSCKPSKTQSVEASAFGMVGTVQVELPKLEQSKSSNGLAVGVFCETKNLGKLSDVPSWLMKPIREASMLNLFQFSVVRSPDPHTVTGVVLLRHSSSLGKTEKTELPYSEAKARPSSEENTDRSIAEDQKIEREAILEFRVRCKCGFISTVQEHLRLSRIV